MGIVKTFNPIMLGFVDLSIVFEWFRHLLLHLAYLSKEPAQACSMQDGRQGPYGSVRFDFSARLRIRELIRLPGQFTPLDCTMLPPQHRSYTAQSGVNRLAPFLHETAVVGCNLTRNQGTVPNLSRRRDKVMVATSKIILPYEPGYVANKEADKRRKETKERLRQREREFAERQQPPLIVPERLRAVSVGGSSSL